MAARCSCLKLVPTHPAVSDIVLRGRISGRIALLRVKSLIRAPVRHIYDQDLIGVSEPWLPAGVTMLVHVPPGVNFHELPWKSIVDVPWQVVPGPAAQSFCPFSATPKHFSL